MSQSQDLDNFCQVLVSALSAMKKANELPPYLSGKARDVNASFIEKQLNEQLEDDSILMQLMNSSKKNRICSLDDFKSKASILLYIEEIKPFLERIKSSQYQLILQRFMAAHELAVKLSSIIDEIEKNEQIKERSSLIEKAL